MLAGVTDAGDHKDQALLSHGENCPRLSFWDSGGLENGEETREVMKKHGNKLENHRFYPGTSGFLCLSMS